MSHLVLHVGTHKTATTSVQDTLAANRALLAARGVAFPQVGPSAGQHALVTRWIPLPERYCDPRPALELWQGLAAAHAGGTGTLLLSSEEFSRATPAVDMRELAALTAGFARRTLVCTLRSQISYIQSVYLQVVRDSRVAAFPEFVRQAVVTNQATGVRLDYGALYDHLLTGFAPDEIVFLSYEAAAKAPGGVLGAILAAAGLAPDLAGALAPLERPSNISAPPLAAWAANEITPMPGPDLVALAAAAFEETFGAEARSTLYTRAEARATAEHFAPLNAAFEARYRAVDPDFALAPLELAPELVYRGQLTEPRFWVALARRLIARGG
jgi:hypothetical protein